MELRPGIILDFDDTLVKSFPTFLRVQQQYGDRMRGLGLYDEGLMLAVNAQDIANVDAMGYMALECFPLALGQVYERYCLKFGVVSDPRIRAELEELGWQVYEYQPELMEGAQELLQALQGGPHHLVLLTQGEETIQRRRLEASGLLPYLQAVHIRPKKNAAVLRQVLAEERLLPEATWYLGNSLRSDINPALEAGLKAVLFASQSWSYEHQESAGGYQTVTRLGDFLKLLEVEKTSESSSSTI